MLPASLFRYIWATTRRRQLQLLLLTAVIAPLSMVPLELQRRIVDHAVLTRNVHELLLLGAVYVAVALGQGGLKYALNMTRGRVLEDVARDIRRRVLARVTLAGATFDQGTTVSMLAAEAEDVAGFAGESLSSPILQGATIAFVAGYLVWVQPLVAMLAVLVYLPQAVLVPRVQRAINRLARARTAMVRRLGREATGGAAWPVGQRPAHAARALRLIEHIYATRIRIYLRKYLLTALGNLLDALGPIVVLVVGGWLVIQGRTEVSTIVVFISGFQKIADPWDQLINFYRTASNARVSYGLIATALAPEGTAP